MYLFSGGSVTNASSGSITGLIGVDARSGATLTDAGTILGIDDKAVLFQGTVSDLLILDPGAVFFGFVVGSPSASNALQLAPGSGTGTLDGLGSRFVTNFETVTVESGAHWDLTGTSTIAASVTFDDKGSLTIDGTLTNANTIPAAITLSAGAVLTNAATAAITNNSTAAIYSESGTVTIDNYGSIAGTGSLTVLSDALDLNPNAYVTNATSASIIGVRSGLLVAGATTVVNGGSIAGTDKYGVDVGSSSQVTNAASGRITGGIYGVFTEGASAASVMNSGSIAAAGGTGSGVRLGSGGSVTNAATTASITGYRGVAINGVGTVVNDGTVTGGSTGGDGITLDRGGSITNASAALISGYHGVDGSGGVATITNSGSIKGTGAFGYGIDLTAGGSITNLSSASIKGATGIDITGGPESVVNGGGVTGSRAAASSSGPAARSATPRHPPRSSANTTAFPSAAPAWW